MFFPTFHLPLLLTRVTSTEHCLLYGFMPCTLEINSNGRFKRGQWSLSLQPLKTPDLPYHNTYALQTWDDGDLPWDLPSIKSHDLLIM